MVTYTSTLGQACPVQGDMTTGRLYHLVTWSFGTSMKWIFAWQLQIVSVKVVWGLRSHGLGWLTWSRLAHMIEITWSRLAHMIKITWSRLPHMIKITWSRSHDQDHMIKVASHDQDHMIKVGSYDQGLTLLRSHMTKFSWWSHDQGCLANTPLPHTHTVLVISIVTIAKELFLPRLSTCS